MKKIISLWGILFISFILFACGDIGWDMVISSSGTYQVSAMVNEVSLDTCSLVGRESDIYPYFKNSLVNDPDVRGLVVFLEDAQGEQISGKFHYGLAGESVETVEAAETVEAKDETPQGEVGEDGKSGGELVPPAEFPEEFIRVPRLDQRLPAFIFPEELPIGYYTLVFQVLGEKEVLYRLEKAVYYIADARFDLTDLQSYLPDVLAGGHLASPGDNILLEALVEADERLAPYVIWYSGKQNIAEGYVSEGAARFMWKVPEQPVFHTIRVEVFPVMPNERIRRSITGKTKELLFPVSTKNERKKSPVDEDESFTHWYDFGGTLKDVYNPSVPEYELAAAETTVPNWKPHAGLYGLSLDEGDLYDLPGSLTALKPQEQGRGRIKLQFAALGTGRIVGLDLDVAEPSAGAVSAALSLGEAGLVLSLETGTERLEESLELEAGDYNSVVFEYTISGRRLEMSVSNNSRLSLDLELEESFFTGTGTLHLGSGPIIQDDDAKEAAAAKAGDNTIVIINELKTRYDIQTPAQEGETLAAAEAPVETVQTTL
jgi:hypothetical protein